MDMKTYLFLSLAIITVFAQNKLTPPAHLSVSNCHPDHPFNGFGDYIITDNNYSSIVMKNKFLMVIGMAGWCKACCRHEEFYYNLMNRYLLNPHINPLANITKVARLDFAIQESSEINKEFKILRVPFLIFFKNGKPYPYNDILDYSKIVRFVNRLNQPFIKAKTLEQMENFLTREEKDYDGHTINTIKVIGFFYDPEETVEDQIEFENSALLLLKRTEVYFCIMTNQTEIKKAKKKYQEKWFEDYTLTSVVIQHAIGKYTIIDISELVLGLKKLSTTIEGQALKLIDELNTESFRFYDEKQKPLLVFVIDSFVNIESSRKILRMAEEVAKDYIGKVLFAWVDGNLNNERKKLLGIEHSRMPAMAFFRIDFENKISYPGDWPINKETIREFIIDYISMPLVNVIEKYETNQKKLKKSVIYIYLKQVKSLDETSFDQLRNEKNDLVVLFFNSRRDVNLISLALNYNQIAKRFADFQLDSVKITLFDIFYNDKPELIKETLNEPLIVLFPQEGERDNYLKYEEEFKAEKLMNFVATNSNGRINLPEFPHISEDLIDEYLTDQVSLGENFNDEKYLKYKDEL